MENIICPLCGDNMVVNGPIRHDGHILIKNIDKLVGVIHIYNCSKAEHIISGPRYIVINDEKFGPYFFISREVLFINYNNNKKTFAFIYKDAEGYFIQINDKKYGPFERYPILIYDNGFTIKTASGNKFNNFYQELQWKKSEPFEIIRMEFKMRVKEAKAARQEHRKARRYSENVRNACETHLENIGGGHCWRHSLYLSFIHDMDEAENNYMHHLNIDVYLDELFAKYRVIRMHMDESEYNIGFYENIESEENQYYCENPDCDICKADCPNRTVNDFELSLCDDLQTGDNNINSF